ncbi:hypothetical protein CRX72_03745 [Pantoea sp. BRM17]|nr:hypothetical protein CRX72_03745 [Pantoea sp. BRM17]
MEARHNKRRIVQAPFAELVHRKLKLGGVFHMATDWEDYATHMLEVMNSVAGYVNQSATQDYVPRPETSQNNPQQNFLGIEVHAPGVGACLASAKEAGVENLRVMCHDAVEVLEHMIPDNSLRMVQLFFPDPWHPLRRIRSFVRRQGRLTKGQQLALDQYWPVMGVEYQPAPLDMTALFGRDAPLVLEIGFGMGASLVTMGRKFSVFTLQSGRNCSTERQGCKPEDCKGLLLTFNFA